MTERFRRGLVVGKFCPLHRGHEFLIRRAQAQCDELLVLSYTRPGFEGYDRERRAGWLQACFPSLSSLVLDDAELARRCAAHGLAPRTLPHDDAPAEEHRGFVAWLLRHLLGGPVDAVFTSETYGEGFAAALAQAFASPVRAVCVDPARAAVPVSGTQVRRDPLACRAWLHPAVYADLVPRIAVLGGESTGKTSLAEALAHALATAWVPEYGRERWEQCGGALSLDDLGSIACTQVHREQQQALVARRWLVCDTTPLTTRLYSELMFGQVAAPLARLARRRYTLTLLCDSDFPFVQDGTRRDAAFRARQQDLYRQALQADAVDWQTLSGPPGQRLAQALALVAAWTPG